MDKATALQSLSDVGTFISPLPNSADAMTSLASVTSFVSAISANQPIAPPAPPVITTPQIILTASGQVMYVRATTPSPIKDKWANNSLNAFPFNAPRDGSIPLLLEDILIDTAHSVIYPSGGTPAINNVTLRRISCPSTRYRGIYIRYDSSNWLCEDINLVSQTVNVMTGELPMGVQLKDTAHDLVFRRGVCEGFQHDLTVRDPSGYWNADGFCAERGNYNILVEDWVCRNNTDGGFDFKATNMRLNRCRSEGNARNYRFWTDNNHGQLESVKPIKRGGAGGCRHIGIYGAANNIHIERLVVTDDKPNPIFVNDRTDQTQPLNVTVDSHDFRVPEGTPVTVGKINLVLN